MPLPAGLSTVTVSGQVSRPGSGTSVDPLIGRINFIPDVPQILDTASGALILGTVSAEPDAAGNFSVTLLAPDSAGITPAGWTYTVSFELVGIAEPDEFHITITKDNPTVYLTALAPIGPSDGHTVGNATVDGNLHVVGQLSVGGDVIMNVPAHASHHATGGSDPLTPAAIGAEVAGAGQAAKDYALGLITNDWINVKKAPYNALGDNYTDDRAAIQSAIDAIQTRGGGTVYIPQGTYLLGAPLSIPSGDGIQIIGSGFKTVLKVKPSANCYAFAMTAADTRTAIRDMTIDGNGINQTAASGCIYAAGAITCDFEHIRFTNYRDVALYLGPKSGASAGFGNRVSRCSFAASGAVTGTGVAIQLDTSHENVIADCRIDSSAGSAVVINSRRNVITGCTILAPGTSGTAGAASGVYLDSTSISNVIAGNLFSSMSTASGSRSAVREIAGATNNSITYNSVVTNGAWSAGALELAGTGSLVRGNIGAGVLGDRDGGSSPLYNVKSTAYGAKGDGVTDDTAAIQAALDAAHAAGGGTVYIPVGTYNVSNFLVVYENCTIWAYGATIKSVGNTGLLRNFLPGDLFSGYAGRSNIKIMGGTWDGNASDGTTGTVTAETDVVNFVHCANISVQDVTVQNVSSAHALEFNSCNGGKAVNCKFLGYRDNSGTSARQFSEAVQIDISVSGSSSIGNFDSTPSKNIQVDGCYFGASTRLGVFGRAVGSHTLAAGTTYDNISVTRCIIDGTLQDGIYAYGWKRSRIAGNQIIGTGWSGIKVTMPDPASVSTSPHTIAIEGNEVESAGTDSGIRVVGYAAYKIPGVIITGNTIKSITGNAIHTEYCLAPVVGRNTVDSTTSTGLYCHYSDNANFSDNTVRNTGSNGINIAGSNYASVNDNLIDTTTSNFGLFVGQGADNATNSTNVSLVGNKVLSPASAGIRLSTNATGCTVVGNTVRKNSGAATNALSMAASATGAFIATNDFSGNGWNAATAMSVSTAAPVTGPGGMTALPGTNLVDTDFTPLPALEAALKPSGVYETTSRLRCGTSSTPTSGTLYLVPIWLPKGLVVSNITFISGGTAAGTPTNWWFTLHNASKVAVARTADQLTAAWAANTVKTLPIAQATAGTATSYTTTNSGLHYLGVMVKATTQPNLVGEGSIADVVASISPGFGGTDAGLSTPPTVTGGAFTAGPFGTGSGIMAYAYVS